MLWPIEARRSSLLLFQSGFQPTCEPTGFSR